jgi:hypothetical protein
MAYCFGDSFDLYTATADAVTGYWDSGSTGAWVLAAGRFTGSLAVAAVTGGSTYLVKSSGVNDAIHHIIVAYWQSAALTGTSAGMYLQLSDAATNQCAIVFRSDGAILLTSGGPTGTTLATYTGATTLTSQWFAYEFEVVIHPTAGRFRVRKNGNTSDDFDSGATLPTRPGTNSYANKLAIGLQGAIASRLDDLLWRSDASSVPFVGDVRCYTRMPASDASVQFSRTPTGPVTQTVPASAGTLASANNDFFTQFTASYSGTVTSVGVVLNAVGTATAMKCAIFTDNGSNAPGAVLASASPAIVTPATGTTPFTFSPGVAVIQGSKYWIGSSVNVSASCFYQSASSAASTSGSAPNAYATFPQANPVISSPAIPAQKSWTFNTAPANYQAVNEAQQDSATSYVYSSNVGDTDLYGIASIAVTPASTIAVTTRAFVQKSDAGSRNGKVVLKSGSTTVDTGSAPLSTTWLQMYRTDTVDPATGTAWTAVGVNAAQIGVTVTA